MITKLKSYNNIWRWDKDFNTERKKDTINKLNNLLTLDNFQKRYFFIKVIKELIDFKIARQNNDINSQENSLNNLTMLCEEYKEFKIEPEELMKLVRHQSYLFQSGLPNTFKKFLKSILLTENEIQLFEKQKDFLNKNSITLERLIVPLNFKFNLFVGTNDSIEGQITLSKKHNIWHTILSTYSKMIDNSSGFIFTPNVFFNDEILGKLKIKEVPIIIVYNYTQSENKIIKYFLDNNYPFIKEINNICDDFYGLLSLLQEKYDLDNKNNAQEILSKWLEKFKSNFKDDQDLLEAHKDFQNLQNQKNNNSQYNNKQNESNHNSYNDNNQQSNLNKISLNKMSDIEILKQYIKEYNNNNTEKIKDINKEPSNIEELCEIRKQLFLWFHPDKQTCDKEKYRLKFVQINKALNALKSIPVN